MFQHSPSAAVCLCSTAVAYMHATYTRPCTDCNPSISLIKCSELIPTLTNSSHQSSTTGCGASIPSGTHCKRGRPAPAFAEVLVRVVGFHPIVDDDEFVTVIVDALCDSVPSNFVTVLWAFTDFGWCK